MKNNITGETSYNAQFDRAKRWFDRFTQINDGRYHTISSNNYLDEVYAFFQNCYHLKDWIKNDETAGDFSTSVENYVNNNRHLRLCADICNGSKHFKLNKQKSGENPRMRSKHHKLNLSTDPPVIAIQYSIVTDSGILDAYDLAKKCMAAWDSFLH